MGAIFLRVTAVFVLGLFSSGAGADANGIMTGGPVSCGPSAFQAISKICDLISGTVGKCTITSDSCAESSQEIFTGNKIELASPSNIKFWNGFGGAGDIYNVATTCLLRDLAETPGQKTMTVAKASSPLGDLKARQEIGFLSYDKKTRVFEGYQRLQACAPVVGCLDTYLQRFRVKPTLTPLTGAGHLAGQYEVYESHALDLWADGQDQSIKVELQALTVNTPYGSVEAKPEFGFGRRTGFVVSPYDGNTTSLVPSPMAKLETTDVYGRVPGLAASKAVPFKNLGDNRYESHPTAWMSAIALGSRDPNPKSAVWKPAAGVSFPARPDYEFNQARSGVEKMPNAYLGASVRVAYKPLDILPGALKALCGASPVSVCIEQFEVFVKPTIDTGFSSQLNFNHLEGAKWNGALINQFPDLRPQNMDQFKGVGLFYGASAASRFALEAGVDFAVRLKINIPIIDDIDKLIVDVHPKTTVAEKTDAQSTVGGAWGATTQVSKALLTKQFFQNYLTLNGSVNGLDHIKACLAQPSATGPEPAEPTYTPGKPDDLIKGIEYPCNLCVGHPTITWTDEKGVQHTKNEELWTVFAADQSVRPAGAQWACNYGHKIGCFDMCSYDPVTKKLTVRRTAKEMIASGEAKNMARFRCGRK